MTPATDTVRPLAVDRNAANAPPARMALSRSPRVPGVTAEGSSSTTESARVPAGRLGR
jgi:hypothetical protein